MLSIDGKRRRKSKSKCRNYLGKKIALNIDEYKNGLYVSKAQAIAVAYKQIGKKHPACKRVLRLKKSRSRSKRRSKKRSRRSRK